MKRRVLVVLLVLAFCLCAFSCTANQTPVGQTDESSSVPDVAPQTEAVSDSDLPSTDPTDPAPADEEDPSDETIVPTVLYVRSKVDALYIRIGAGTSFRALGTLDKDDMVVYSGEENGWYETRYLGQVAYVSANPSYTELFSMTASSETIESVVSVGCLYLGTPYVYGATRYLDGSGNRIERFSDDAFDCSSFMQYIFYEGAGVTLGLTTRTQVKEGEAVDDDLRRGDLLFFTNASRRNYSGVHRVGHVALYLGDGYLLHTASDHAVIEPFTPARQANFICARRMV